MPFNYRRLTAHLNNAYPPNNKLAAYLATNVSMRNMVQQAVHDSYNQQYGMPSGGQQLSQPQPQTQMFPNSMAGPQSLPYRQAQSASTYRQAPYSSPRPPNSQSSHSRSASIATPQDLSGNMPISPVVQSQNDRRMSLPAVSANAGSPIDPQTPVHTSSSKSNQRPSFPAGSFSQGQVPQQKPPSMRAANAIGPSNNDQNYGPFSTALPQDAQMFFNPNFSMNDMSMGMMTGNNNFLNSNWNLDSATPSTMGTDKQQQTHPTFSGLNATLAPSAPTALDSNKSSSLDTNAQFNPYTGTSNFDDMFFGHDGTPGAKLEEDGWDDLVDWHLPASQQSQSST